MGGATYRTLLYDQAGAEEERGSPGAVYVLTSAIRCYPVLSGSTHLNRRIAKYQFGPKKV